MRSRVLTLAITLMMGSLLGLVVAPPPVSATSAHAAPGQLQGGAVTLAAGSHHTCAILDNAVLKCWGLNNWGQLGIGRNVPSYGGDPEHMRDSLPPVALGAGRTPTAIAAGGATTCAILDNGTVKCWGAGDVGQLGLGNSNDLNKPAANPVDLGPGRTARAIAVGASHVCTLLDDDSIKCWGANGVGQLGDGSNQERRTPVSVRSLGAGRTAQSIAAGSQFTCALLDNGTVKCWGLNSSGQLGSGGGGNLSVPPASPINLGAGRTAVAIAAGSSHACAILDTGGVKCWGVNTNGQLGVGSFGGSLSAPPANPINLGPGARPEPSWPACSTRALCSTPTS